MTAVLHTPVEAGTSGNPLGPASGVALRQVRRGALVVLVVTMGTSALVAVQYRSLVSGPLDVQAVAALAGSPAIRTLFGEPVGLDTAGGFTVWRTGTFLAVLVGAWAVLAATGTTRAAESSGQWSLLLAGPLRLPSVVAAHLGVLAAATTLVGTGVAVALLLAGAGTAGSLLYGAGLTLVGVLFGAVGVLAAQVVDERRTATAAAAGVLVAWLLLRMVADGFDALGWAMWLTPFGLLAEVAPYAGDRLAPLAVLAVDASIVAGLAVAAAGRRDVGGGLLPPRALHRPRLALLGSVPSFALRRALPTLAGWALALGAYFLLIGVLAVSMTEFLAANPAFAKAAAAAGFSELGSVAGYAASLLGLLPVPLGLFAAARLAAAAGDESERRLDLLLAGPVSRTRWAATEAAITALGCVALAGAAALALWAGASLVGAPLPALGALAGALNGLPVALVGLGAALAALGWVPRAVIPLGALPVAGGFLLLVLADSLAWPDWVRAVSPFAHVSAVPVERADVAGVLGLLAVAAALAAGGIAGLRRRDLRA